MSLKLLIDLNLSPEWVTVLAKHGWQPTHWSSVGDPRAPDREIMTWAQDVTPTHLENLVVSVLKVLGTAQSFSIF